MQINIVDTSHLFSYTHTQTHTLTRTEKRSWTATDNQITENSCQPWFCVFTERSHLHATLNDTLHRGHKPHGLIQINLINALRTANQGMQPLQPGVCSHLLINCCLDVRCGLVTGMSRFKSLVQQGKSSGFSPSNSKKLNLKKQQE